MARLENPTVETVEPLLVELERKIETLRVRYEQYFIGVERRAPEQMRKDVVRLMRDLETTFIRNTAQKFRLQTSVQRFNTYKTYWNRILRQIEEGTYKRDQLKAGRNQERRSGPEEDQDRDQVYELDLDLDMVDDFEAVANQYASQPPVDEASEREKERIKQQRLLEIQRQLGLGGAAATAAPAPAPAPSVSAPGSISAQDREAKLSAMRQKLESRSRPAPTQASAPASAPKNELPAGGADYEKLRKIRQMKEKLNKESGAQRTLQRTSPTRTSPTRRPSQGGNQGGNQATNRPATGAHPAATRTAATRTTGPQRVIERPSSASSEDQNARRIYNSLVEAKRRCKESTDNLTFDTVKRSMQEQREQLRQSRGSKDVDFQVVIKDGRAFLKPDPKD